MPEEACGICGDKYSVECNFCSADKPGTCYIQVDVDSFYPYSCTCDDGKQECQCVAGHSPIEPTIPRAAFKIRGKVLAGPWA